MSVPEVQMLWQVSEPRGKAIIWSVRYKSNEPKAVKKYRRLADSNGEDVSARMLTCPVDDCWNFATQLLASGELSNNVPNAWWIVADVEVRPGDDLHVSTVCPMCEKHARRFRRTMQERIFHLEERMDSLHKSMKEFEHEHWT